MLPEGKAIIVSTAPIPAGIAIRSALPARRVSSRSSLREREAVLAHHQATVRIGIVEVLEVLDVTRGFGESLRVGVVRSHEDVTSPEERPQLTKLVLIVGRHPHVAFERLARILLVEVRRLAIRLLQLLEEMEDPLRAGFNACDPQVGEPVE